MQSLALVNHLVNLTPGTQTALAERVGMHKANFSAALRGKRPFPSDSVARIYDELGLVDSRDSALAEQHLRTDAIHIWDVHGENIESFFSVIDRIASNIYVGASIFSDDDHENYYFTPLVVMGAESPYVILTLQEIYPTRLKKKRLTITPDVLIETHYQFDNSNLPVEWLDYEVSGPSDDPYQHDPESLGNAPGSVKITPKAFSRLLARKTEPREVLSWLDGAVEKWTWSKIFDVLKIKAGHDPEKAAELLGVERSYRKWVESTFGNSAVLYKGKVVGRD